MQAAGKLYKWLILPSYASGDDYVNKMGEIGALED